MKRILMIAYHFPPLAGSSGIQRTLRFVQHLLAYPLPGLRKKLASVGQWP